MDDVRTSDPIVMTMRAAVEPLNRMYEQLLVIAKMSAPDPTVFDEYEAAFWRIQGSNNKLDFYFSSMADPTLKNFEDDYRRGISFQDSHEWGKLGLGQSITGEIVAIGGEVAAETERPLKQVHANIMTLRGINLGGHKTDDFLAAIRSGVYRDVSVGFYARDISCSICGKQSYQWWVEGGCLHLPGVEYEVGEVGEAEDVERKKKIRQQEVQLAWASVNDGHLMETSQVYDGATPDAAVNQVIIKANALSAQRMITHRETALIERRYMTRLKEPRTLVAVNWDGRAGTGEVEDMAGRTKRAVDELDDKVEAAAVAAVPEDAADVADGVDADPVAVGPGTKAEPQTLPSAEPTVTTAVADGADAVATADDGEIPDETVIEPVAQPAAEPDAAHEGEESADVLAGERARLVERGIKLGKDPVKAVRTLADELHEERRRNAELTADAALGRQYRQNTIKDTLAEGVRARGDGFKQDSYEAILNTLSIDQIVVIRDDFKAEAVRALTVTPPVNIADRAGADAGSKPRRKAGAHRA